MSDTRTNLGPRDNPPFGQFPLAQRIPSSRTTYCRLVVFHYEKQNFGTASSVRNPFSADQVFKAKRFVIEQDIASVRIFKGLGQPSGTFDIALFPTKNWKQHISPSDWIAIYFMNHINANDNDKITAKNLVMLGNVDRIYRNIERNQNDDKVELRYSISGRNFGKVFETTDIWFDPHMNQDKTLDTLLITAGMPLTGNPTDLSTAILNIFLGYGKVPASTLAFDYPASALSRPLNQWRVPYEMRGLFEGAAGDKTYNAEQESTVLGSTLFYDLLRKNITSTLPGYKTRAMLGIGGNGNLWNLLEQNCNSLINELFLEEIRDSSGRAFPSIVIRPRPLNTPFLDSVFGPDIDAKSQLKGMYKTMQQLADESYVEISPAEIIYENVGKDDHSLFNMYWLTSDRGYEASRSLAANLRTGVGVGNPFFIRESIQRNGLRRMETVEEFCIPQALNAEATSEVKLFQAFMAQIYDINFANHLYESGTIETSGVLEAELGKVLTVLPSEPKYPKKIFYIEGYEHSWQFPNTWKTIFTVTHGQFRSADNKIFIDASPDDYGQLDAALDQTYLAKTGMRTKP